MGSNSGPGSEMAGSAGKNRVPQGRVGRLFGGSQKEDAVWSKELVNAGHQRPARVLREVEHDVAQKDDIEALMEWQRPRRQFPGYD